MSQRPRHPVGLLAGLLAFVAGGTPPVGVGAAEGFSIDSPGGWSLDALSRLNPLELESLYRSAPPAPLLSGRVRGRALLRPGTRVGPSLSKAAGMAWQGKVFRGDGTAINKFFGLPAIRAEVGPGVSWMDGGPALILDYRDTSRIYRPYRDEIRQVAPGLYLGAMYRRTCPAPTFVMYFALEAPCQSR